MPDTAPSPAPPRSAATRLANPITSTVAAELLKLARRPAVWALLGAAMVLSLTFAYLIPYLSYTSGSESDISDGATPEQLLASMLPGQLVASTIGGYAVFAGALSLVLGALMFGGEYGWGTVKTMLTQRPGRGTVLAGQLTALAIAVFVGVAILFSVSAATSATIATVEGKSLDWPSVSSLAEGVAYGWFILFTWATLGALLGVALRGVAMPIGLGVVWVLGVENLLNAMADSVLSALEPLRELLPGVNAGSLILSTMSNRAVEPPPGVTSAVSEGRALVTLVGYLVVAVGLALWTVRRRDVV